MGNLEGDGGNNTFTYDAAGRLETATKSGGVSITNQYNGKGERVFTHRVMPFNARYIEYYTYAEDGRLLTFTQSYQNPDDSLGARSVYNFIWMDNIPVAQFREQYDSGGNHIESQLVYIHTDHLYTPKMATGTSAEGTVNESNEAVVWSVWNSPFGWSFPKYDPDGDSEFVNIILRFPGQAYYGIGSYNYNYYRDYDAFYGRYLESDPIGLSGGMNTYSYASNNPMKNIDPLGLVDWNGTYVQYSGGFGGAAGWYTFMLTSECVDGERTSVRVRAAGIGGGLGFTKVPFSASGAEITLRDPWKTVHPMNLVGNFVHASSGLSVGGGIGAGSMVMGDAEMVGLVSPIGGVEANALSLIMGYSWIVPDSVWAQKCDQVCQ
jgi:RHS repeat-associated protein